MIYMLWKEQMLKKQGAEATKKVEKEKKDEQQLWARLKTLNKELKNINESKKKATKKFQKQY